METRYDLSYKPSWTNAVPYSPLGSNPTPPITGDGAGTTSAPPATEKKGIFEFANKLLGVAKQGADIYGQYKNPPVIKTGNEPPPPGQETFLGMPKPIGIGITVGVLALVGFGIYKLATKK